MAVHDLDLEMRVLMASRLIPTENGIVLQMNAQKIAVKTDRTSKTVISAMDSICSRYPTVVYDRENRICVMPAGSCSSEQAAS